MKAYFEYKGISSLDMHLRILNEISFPSPEADIEFVEIIGKDGELAIDNERLKGVNFPIPVVLKTPSDKTVEQASTDISNWLKNDIGWYPLKFLGSSNYEYIAMCYEQFDIEETLKRFGKTVITFRLKPYKRFVGEKPIVLFNGQTIVNKGTRVAKPLIRIEGHGDITLTNNGKDWLMLTGIDGHITVDSESMNVFRDNAVQFTKMKSHLRPLFPVLDVGNNKIEWTGNVTKIELTPRTEVVF